MNEELSEKDKEFDEYCEFVDDTLHEASERIFEFRAELHTQDERDFAFGASLLDQAIYRIMRSGVDSLQAMKMLVERWEAAEEEAEVNDVCLQCQEEEP